VKRFPILSNLVSYSSEKMSTLDTIVKDYNKNIVLRDCQRQAFEYLHKKLSHDRSLQQNLEYINILQESCKIETFTEIDSLQGPTTLYGRLG
jgi:antitoxin component YwqK of YwqJK toxin-antitoxin module